LIKSGKVEATGILGEIQQKIKASVEATFDAFGKVGNAKFPEKAQKFLSDNNARATDIFKRVQTNMGRQMANGLNGDNESNYSSNFITSNNRGNIKENTISIVTKIGKAILRKLGELEASYKEKAESKAVVGSEAAGLVAVAEWAEIVAMIEFLGAMEAWTTLDRNLPEEEKDPEWKAVSVFC
jgi:hypothetical protein